MANQDREVIDQVRAAIADIERLRADALEIINNSHQLLRMMDQMNRPLMNAPTDNER